MTGGVHDLQALTMPDSHRRLIAAHEADRLRKKLGMTWDQLIIQPTEPSSKELNLNADEPIT